MQLDDLIEELNLLRKSNGNLPVVLNQSWGNPAVNTAEIVDIPTGWSWREGRRESVFCKAVGISWVGTENLKKKEKIDAAI